MDRIIKALDDMGIYHKIDSNYALVEFWTDTAGQDIPTEFEYDGTASDFVKQFTKCAYAYDVDEEIELYVGMRGQRGVPERVRDIIDDCEEAKETLLNIANALLQAYIPDDEP